MKPRPEFKVPAVALPPIGTVLRFKASWPASTRYVVTAVKANGVLAEMQYKERRGDVVRIPATDVALYLEIDTGEDPSGDARRDDIKKND